MSTVDNPVTGTTNDAIAAGIDALQVDLDALLNQGGGSISAAQFRDIGTISTTALTSAEVVNVASDGFLRINLTGTCWANAPRHDQLEVWVDGAKKGHIAVASSASEYANYGGVVVVPVVAGNRSVQLKLPSANLSFIYSRRVTMMIEVI